MQEPREVNRVVCKFGRWPYVREDYAVRREVFEDILLGLGVPDPPVDAFATEANHLCPVWWGPGGEHEDAFAQSWKGQFLWMNPPYSMLDKVVHKLTEDGASAILVVPNWPHRLWWRRLQVMVTTSLFSQGVIVCLSCWAAFVGPFVGKHGHILSQVPPW